MAEKGFKCFYTVLSLAAVVVLAACGGSETEKAETPAAKNPEPSLLFRVETARRREKQQCISDL